MQEDEIVIKIYLSNRYAARRTLSKFSDNGWKVGSIDSLLKGVFIATQLNSTRLNSTQVKGPFMTS